MTSEAQLEITIRPVQQEELDVLEKVFSPHTNSKYHFKRYAVQEKGEGVYLIAWHKEIPVGHFLLRWQPHEKDIANGFPNNVAYLEAGGTREEFRRKGVGTRLIHEAERLAKEKGFKQIGMAVGSSDNPDARRLYEKLGYKDWGEGEVTVSWEYIDKNGNKGTESEVCIYMLKDL